MEDPTKGYEPMSPRTREEFIAALEEHDRQQRRQLFFRQLGSISPLNRYQSVRYRCLQRSSLWALNLWQIGMGNAGYAHPRRAELAM